MNLMHGYIRVSTDDQADSGLGLEAQREAIIRYFEYQFNKPDSEVRFGRIYEDRATSAKLMLRQRTAGARMSADLCAGDVVVFAKLDRGFRDVEDTLQTVRIWRDRGVRVIFLDLNMDTASPAGEMMLTMMAAVARFERRRISERVKEAIHQAKKRGSRPGRPPFGTKMSGPQGRRKLVLVADEFTVGKWIVEWRLKRFTWEQIYFHLKKNDIGRPRLPGDPLRRTGTKREWSVRAIRMAYRGTLKVLRWIEEGLIEAPKDQPADVTP